MPEMTARCRSNSLTSVKSSCQQANGDLLGWAGCRSSGDVAAELDKVESAKEKRAASQGIKERAKAAGPAASSPKASGGQRLWLHGEAGSCTTPVASSSPASKSRTEPLSRPGSSGSKNSMMRLPDEPPTPGGSSAVAAPARPGSGHSQTRPRPAILRLPDEPGTPVAAAQAEAAFAGSGGTPTGRCGSAAQSRKPSLTRLPEDPTPVLAQVPLSRPPSAGQLSSRRPSGSEPGTGKQNMRERLNKSLTVTTGNLDASLSQKPKFFRLMKPGETIQDYYSFAEEIYSGGAKGKVVVARRRLDNSEVIVKIRAKRSNRGGERTWRSIMTHVHQMRGSRHVLDITEILEDDAAFYVVMPKCNGGELFEFLVTETEVPEAECKRIIREILTAVGHLHKGGLVHRDVKPENIMFDLAPGLCREAPAKTPKTVKLIDFDTCVEWTPSSPKGSRFVGTPGYIAPEALLGEITPQSDIWSVGVILYILMTGETPWSSMVSLEDGVVGSPGARKMYNAIKAEVLEWDKEPWPDFPLARDLCQKLMAFSTDERPPSVQEALAHPWLEEP